MSSDRDHVTPLAFATDRPTSDEEDAVVAKSPFFLRRRCLLCCGACAALLVVLGVLILILALTVFEVKEPKLTMNAVTVQNLNLAARLSSPLAFNMTVVADVSVKNPNAASFEFGGSTTSLFYRDRLVGVAYGPPGNARAHRTLRTNVTVDAMGDRLMGETELVEDLASGAVAITSSTLVGGRVEILGMFKHHVDVMMNCSMTIAVLNQSIVAQSCKHRVWL